MISAYYQDTRRHVDKKIWNITAAGLHFCQNRSVHNPSSWPVQHTGNHM